MKQIIHLECLTLSRCHRCEYMHGIRFKEHLIHENNSMIRKHCILIRMASSNWYPAYYV